MSHFSVLVIGENADEQLQPYHEFECTGTDDQYVQEIEEDVEELRKEYVEHNKSDRETKYDTFAEFLREWHGKHLTTAENIDIKGEHQYGYVLVDSEWNVRKVIRRTNPNKQWDWWVVGGRWSGMLKMKPGADGAIGQGGIFSKAPRPGYADQARKGNVDFEGMRQDKIEAAAKEWDEVNQIIGNTPEAKGWDEVRDMMFPGDIDAARTFYNQQERVKAFSIHAGPFNSIDTYQVSRDEFIKRAEDNYFSTFAVVKDGEWHEKGSMGWFGMVSDEKEAGEWSVQFKSFLDSISDDTILTIVDCHI